MKKILKDNIHLVLEIGMICVLVLFILFHSAYAIHMKNIIADKDKKIETLKEEKELDPCPVCHSHNTHIYYDEEHDISIKCEDCGITFGFYQDLTDALAIWNNVKG